MLFPLYLNNYRIYVSEQRKEEIENCRKKKNEPRNNNKSKCGDISSHTGLAPSNAKLQILYRSSQTLT